MGGRPLRCVFDGVQLADRAVTSDGVAERALVALLEEADLEELLVHLSFAHKVLDVRLELQRVLVVEVDGVVEQGAQLGRLVLPLGQRLVALARHRVELGLQLLLPLVQEAAQEKERLAAADLGLVEVVLEMGGDLGEVRGLALQVLVRLVEAGAAVVRVGVGHVEVVVQGVEWHGGRAVAGGAVGEGLLAGAKGNGGLGLRCRCGGGDRRGGNGRGGGDLLGAWHASLRLHDRCLERRRFTFRLAVQYQVVQAV